MNMVLVCIERTTEGVAHGLVMRKLLVIYGESSPITQPSHSTRFLSSSFRSYFWKWQRNSTKPTFDVGPLVEQPKLVPYSSHTTFWKSITKVTPFSIKGPILHRDSISFHLSHQPPLSVMCHFLCSKSVTLWLKSVTFTTWVAQLVDGSNESLYYPFEELGPNLKME